MMSPDETRRLLAVASSLKVRMLLSHGYGCGLRAGEVVRLKVKHIDSAQKIIRCRRPGRRSGHRPCYKRLAARAFASALKIVTIQALNPIGKHGGDVSCLSVRHVTLARDRW